MSGETLKPDKIMTREEYDALNLQGWHCVNHTAEPGATYLIYGLHDACPTPTVEGGELVERLRAMASTGGRITCMAEYFGGAVMPSNLIAARLCADAADALASRDAEIERLSAALGEAERAINRAKEAVEDQDDIELVGSLDAALSTLKTAREGNNA